MTTRHRRALAAVLTAASLTAAGCSGGSANGTGAVPGAEQDAGDAEQGEAQEASLAFVTAPPEAQTQVVPVTDPAAAALTASQALFTTAPVVVLAAEGAAGAGAHAMEIGAPVLVAAQDTAPLLEELDRLGTEAVLVVGAVPQAVTDAVRDAEVDVVEDPADLPVTRRAAELSGVLVLSDGQPWTTAAVASAQAAGAQAWSIPHGDPRAESVVVESLGQNPPTHVLALGSVFGDQERVADRVAVAATGVQLPGGGQVVFPHRRMVALYGHPGTSALGVLGEQPVDEAVERARSIASDYDPLSDVPVVPAFEIITTIASASAGADGDYSAESTIEKIRPWVDAAREAGIYVLLDLQPGRTDFLTQAKIYEELLLEPHVGLALDPEWRLEPGQRHMEQIGSVHADEVNAVADWLAELTRDNRLPQKVLVLHQFRLSMIEDRDRVDTSHDELAIVIHADGNGTPGEKFATWDALRATAPDGVFWAWKNFYDEDRPTFSPEQTMDVEPAPLLVTYQ